MIKTLDRDPVIRENDIFRMSGLDLLDTLLHYAAGESSFYQQCKFELETALRGRLKDYQEMDEALAAALDFDETIAHPGE